MERKVWFLWLQGIENAPELVRRCHRSWVERSGWDVVTLDETSLSQYTSIDHGRGVVARQSPNHRSDLIRLDLLSTIGGVWADATCFCVSPLDDWLPAATKEGFFAFDRPHPNRLLASWLLASERRGVIATRMFEETRRYFQRHPYRRSEFWEQHLDGSARRRRLWFTRLFYDGLKVAPYFFFHYQFERLLEMDHRVRSVWDLVPKVPADGPHRIQREGLFKQPSAGLREEIDERRVPVYKLTWKVAETEAPPSSALSYLLRS